MQPSRMRPMEAPTPRARQIVQQKRKFFVVAGLLFVIAAAVLLSAVASHSDTGFVIFPILVVVGIFLLLLPIGVGHYVEDHDLGRPQQRQELWLPVTQVFVGLVLVVLQVIQLTAFPRVDMATLRWVLLAVGAAMMLVGLAQLTGTRRRRKLHNRQSGRDEDAA